MSRYELSEKSLRKLKFLEEKYPIDSLKYRNINIFPLIRLLLSRQSYVEKKNIYYNKILSKFLTFLKIPKFYFDKIRFNQTLKTLNKKNIELVFFSDHLFHYDKIKNKKINLFIDPYLEAVKKNYNTLKIEIVSNNFKKTFKKRNEPFYLKLFSNIT